MTVFGPQFISFPYSQIWMVSKWLSGTRNKTCDYFVFLCTVLEHKIITNINQKWLLTSTINGFWPPYWLCLNTKACLLFVLQGPARDVNAESLTDQPMLTVTREKRWQLEGYFLSIYSIGTGSLIPSGKRRSGGRTYCGSSTHLKDRD